MNILKTFKPIWLILIVVSFLSCKKEKDAEEDNKDPEPKDEVITSAPSSFEAKAVIEMFGGEWCDKCPAGTAEVKKLSNANPDNVYGAIIHYNDGFETVNYNALSGHLGGVGSFPSAAINRSPAQGSGDEDSYSIYSKEYWARNLARLVNKKTNIGLALETKIGADEASIKVLVNGSGLDEGAEYRLTLYILEDNVPSVDQKGADANYLHQMMLRGSLTSSTGDVILLKEKETFVKDFTLNLKGSTFVTENIKILCFVNSIGGNSSTRVIVNAQQVKLGKTANWD